MVCMHVSGLLMGRKGPACILEAYSVHVEAADGVRDLAPIANGTALIVPRSHYYCVNCTDDRLWRT